MHQNSQTSIRKLAFRRACNRVFRSQTSQQYRHGTLTPDYVRQSALEPPPLPAHSTGNSQSPSPPTPLPERRPRGGTHSRPLRMLSWNAGHRGVQQWAEVTAWLHAGASDSCDVMALQETHWNETAEFTVLTTDTATKLRAWHAAKIRAVLNKPAHLTHISTADLYKQYGIKDPVQKLADRQANRVKRLEQRSRIAHQDDVSTAPAALEQARQKLKQYLLTQQPPTVGAPACPCPDCDQVFETPTGLRAHVGKMHPGTVDRFVTCAYYLPPGTRSFRTATMRGLHEAFFAVEGPQGPSLVRRVPGAGKTPTTGVST